MEDKIIVAIIGLIAGGIGSLVAPWVAWGIERRRIQLNRKVEYLKEWRSLLNDPTSTFHDIVGNPVCHFMEDRKIIQPVEKEFEVLRSNTNSISITVSPEEALTINGYKTLLLKKTVKLEEQWRLV